MRILTYSTMPKDQNNTVQEIVEGVREALRVSLPFASDTNFTKFCEDLESRLCSFRDITYTAGMEAERERILERLPEKNPNESRLRQNRNGIDYCGTCEQGWEDCSCPARNTGYNTALSEIRTIIEQV